MVWDTVIAGASPDGIAAAISAADHGLQVLLLEESSNIGGESCRPFACHIEDWAQTYLNNCISSITTTLWSHRVYDPVALEDLFWEQLISHNVTVRTNYVVYRAKEKNNSIQHFKTASQNKKEKIKAKVYIDAQSYEIPRDNLNIEEKNMYFYFLLSGIYWRQNSGECFNREQWSKMEASIYPVVSHLEIRPFINPTFCVIGIEIPYTEHAYFYARRSAEQVTGWLRENVPGFSDCSIFQMGSRPVFKRNISDIAQDDTDIPIAWYQDHGKKVHNIYISQLYDGVISNYITTKRSHRSGYSACFAAGQCAGSIAAQLIGSNANVQAMQVREDMKKMGMQFQQISSDALRQL